ncbi:hypothetical protein BH10ACI1_BH10ACI1_33090 [soil metagenome]
MRNKLLNLFITAIILLIVSSASVKNVNSQTQKVWNPQKTWVFFVGLLEWQDSETFASYPQQNRRDVILLDVLRQRGVPENQIMYLQDREATTEKIKSSLQTFLSKAQPDDWVFFYYSGHGYKSEDNRETFFAGYDADDHNMWNINSVPDAIDTYFKGSNALIMLDNCYSGAMAEAVEHRKSRVSYAVLASSHFNSSSTGNWTFTESLIYAFRGESFIDDDSDGEITLAELAQNSADDMLFAEEQITEFTFTGSLKNQTVIAVNVPRADSRVGERIEAFDQGNWYRAIITSKENNKFKVHFYGYEYDEDAFRTATQIRQFVPKSYAVGSRVEAESDGEWYQAKVLEVKGGAHFVHYVEYGREYDEWVSSDRIRLLRQTKKISRSR